MTDEEKWKRRFHLFVLVRLAGLGLFFLGLAIAFTDLFREGGWPLVGAIVAIVGAVDAVVAPKVLKAAWEREDR